MTPKKTQGTYLSKSSIVGQHAILGGINARVAEHEVASSFGVIPDVRGWKINFFFSVCICFVDVGSKLPVSMSIVEHESQLVGRQVDGLPLIRWKLGIIAWRHDDTRGNCPVEAIVVVNVRRIPRREVILKTKRV
jgi:hypothetical protein